MSLFDLLQQPQQQAAPTTGLGLLLGEAQKTAGMLTKNLGNIAGVDTRSPRQKEIESVKEIIAKAQGATIEEKLKNALPQIAQVNPVLGIAFSEQLRSMAPKSNNQVVTIDTGRYPAGYTAEQANALGISTIKRKALVDKTTGKIIRYIGEGEEAPAGGGDGNTDEPTTKLTVGRREFLPKGSLNGQQVTSEIGAAPQVEKQNTFPIPQRPKLKVEDIDSPRGGAVRPNVVMGINEKSTPQLRARLKQLNKKALLTPKERQELFEIQNELDKRK